MVIIRMSGGIGNQMFQYALYLQLVSLGKEVKFDDVTEYEWSNARPIALSVFGIDYPKADREEMIRLTDASMKQTDRLRRKLFGRKSMEYHEASFDFDPEVLQKDPAYLCGCFQSERYFKGVEQEVRETFQFRNMKLSKDMEKQAEEYSRAIAGSCAVSIHIRRGDYLQAEDIYGGICTDAYYHKAMHYMLQHNPETHFFVFTNDTFWAQKWCEAKENAEIFTVIQGADEETGYMDMMLMSQCRHHIIANSTFGWWGAWLNHKPDKCVIAPSKWMNTVSCRDIYLPDMVLIP